MDNREKRAKMMGEENVNKILWKLAIPAIVGMLVNAIYNVFDTYFVSKLGTTAIGAVAIVFPLFLIIGAVGLTFGIGSASYISRLLGAKNNKRANKVASTALFSTVVVGIIFTIVGLVFSEEILLMFGASKTILPYAIDYGRIIMFGSLFNMINMCMNNMVRAEGNAKYSMFALSLGAILNIILDPIFIFVFNMGIKGAAVATIFSQMISSIFLLTYYVTKKSYVKISLKKIELSKKMYFEIMKIGIPTFLRQMLASISIALINVAAKDYGDAAVGAIGVVMRITSIALFIIFGYGQGFQPIAGYNYGAKKYDRLHKCVHLSLVWTTLICSVSATIFIVFSKQIIGIFSTDSEVIRIGSYYLVALNVLYPLFGVQNVYAFLFQSIGRALPAGMLSLARQGIFLIPLILILPKIWGLNGVIWSQPIADLLALVLTIILAIKVNKALKIEEKEYYQKLKFIKESA